MVAWGVFAGLAWLAGGHWWAGLTGMFFYGLVPALALILLYRNGAISHVYLPERDQRARLLLLGAGCYFLGCIGLWLAGAPTLMMGAGCVYCGNALLVWRINRHWKISIHAVAVTGGLLLLLVASGGRLWPLSLALVLVAWARLQLQAHTIGQVLGGILLGGVSTGLLIGVFAGW
jgi:membrane-associated phospholipid phosphatase